MWAALVNTLIGVWLMIAPSALDYAGAARTNDHIIGPIAATFAAIAISQVTRGARFVNVATGLWLMIAPFVLDHSGLVAVHSGVAGALLALLSFVRGTPRKQQGGGWSVLWQNPERRRAIPS